MVYARHLLLDPNESMSQVSPKQTCEQNVPVANDSTWNLYVHLGKHKFGDVLRGIVTPTTRH